MGDLQNINLSRLASWIIFALAAIPLNSCSVAKSKNDGYCQKFIEDALGIKRAVKWKHANHATILLTNNNKIRLNSGYNVITHPISKAKTGLFLNIENEKLYSIQRIDTLIQENTITTYEWKILNKTSKYDYTTTDLKGRLIQHFGHTWFIGKGHGDYIDITAVDTLGNTLKEWGTTGSNKKQSRK